MPTPPFARIVLAPNLVSGQGSPECIYLPEELDRLQDIFHIFQDILFEQWLLTKIDYDLFFLAGSGVTPLFVPISFDNLISSNETQDLE